MLYTIPTPCSTIWHMYVTISQRNLKKATLQRSPITLCTALLAVFGGSERITTTLTISKVHTLLIHTFSVPLTPSTSSSSTPSHQHLLAGFLQKSNSFCAIPTALLLAKSPLMSVRSLASAKLQMTALFGSPARWPHRSSWLKPLNMSVIDSVNLLWFPTLLLTSQSSVAPLSQLLRFFAILKKFHPASTKPFLPPASLQSSRVVQCLLLVEWHRNPGLLSAR